MRRKYFGSPVGYICIVTGIMIILSLVLPRGFWWFLLGAGLVCFGVWCNSRCC